MKIKTSLVLIIAFIAVSCITTTNKIDPEYCCNGNEYLENVELSLADFEFDIIATLDEAQNVEDFHVLLRTKLESKCVSEELKSLTTSEPEHFSKKDSLMLIAIGEFKTSIFYGYDESFENGSKTEFINYMDFRQTEFVDNIDTFEFLETQKDKDIFIALMNFEIGIFRTMIEYSDEVIALGDNSSLGLKSASGYSWWQKTKKLAECVLLTQGTAVGVILTFSGIPVADVVGALIAFNVVGFALDCWTNYFYYYI